MNLLEIIDSELALLRELEEQNEKAEKECSGRGGKRMAAYHRGRRDAYGTAAQVLKGVRHYAECMKGGAR